VCAVELPLGRVEADGWGVLRESLGSTIAGRVGGGGGGATFGGGAGGGRMVREPFRGRVGRGPEGGGRGGGRIDARRFADELAMTL
jgi:hypothetical protein